MLIAEAEGWSADTSLSEDPDSSATVASAPHLAPAPGRRSVQHNWTPKVPGPEPRILSLNGQAHGSRIPSVRPAATLTPHVKTSSVAAPSGRLAALGARTWAREGAGAPALPSSSGIPKRASTITSAPGMSEYQRRLMKAKRAQFLASDHHAAVYARYERQQIEDEKEFRRRKKQWVPSDLDKALGITEPTREMLFPERFDHGGIPF
jgi:hypothetical protein